MSQLDRLIRDARQAMKFRGHLPLPAERWHEASNGKSGATIRCAVCEKQANVLCKPQPNEAPIAGEAVALNCNVATANERLDKFVAQADEIRMDAVMGC